MMRLLYTICLVSLVGSVIYPSSQDAGVEFLPPSPTRSLPWQAIETVYDLAVTVRHEKRLLSGIRHKKREREKIECARDAALHQAAIMRDKIIQDARECEGFMTDQGYQELQQKNEQNYQQERAEIVALANGALHQLAHESFMLGLNPKKVRALIDQGEQLRLTRLQTRKIIHALLKTSWNV